MANLFTSMESEVLSNDNATRYYLAIQSYLDTVHIQGNERFSGRLNKWFDLTEKHHLQLHELEKDDYLKYKIMEHQDQLRLQQQLTSTMGNDRKCAEY